MSIRQKGQTAHAQTLKILLLFKNPEPGIYRLGIFLAPAATFFQASCFWDKKPPRIGPDWVGADRCGGNP